MANDKVGTGGWEEGRLTWGVLQSSEVAPGCSGVAPLVVVLLSEIQAVVAGRVASSGRSFEERQYRG